MTLEDVPAGEAAATLVDIERRRLQSLVEADAEVADALHASDFQLVHPGGGTWSRERYLGGIASGDIDYRRFEPVSDIQVVIEGDLAVLSYRSAIEIKVKGREAGSLQCWHTDVYRRDGDAPWRVFWSQATAIEER